jgi:hypothetical protein
VTTGEWDGIAVRLGAVRPHLRERGFGAAEYVRYGRVEVSPKGSSRTDLYDLLGVRSEGQQLLLRYAGRRDDGVITGVPLSGLCSISPTFWTARRPDMTIILFAGRGEPREGRLDR